MCVCVCACAPTSLSCCPSVDVTTRRGGGIRRRVRGRGRGRFKRRISHGAVWIPQNPLPTKQPFGFCPVQLHFTLRHRFTGPPHPTSASLNLSFFSLLTKHLKQPLPSRRISVDVHLCQWSHSLSGWVCKGGGGE